MDEDALLNELYELNLICAECEYRNDAYCCNSCSIFHKIVVIHKILDDLES